MARTCVDSASPSASSTLSSSTHSAAGSWPCGDPADARRQVFTTCGSAAKRAFLRAAFPWLDDAHIGDSRSTAFEATVLQGVRLFWRLPLAHPAFFG